MLIEVTQDDIKNGVAGSAGRCPIALAAQRSFGECVSVGHYACSGTHWLADLPSNAQQFVRDFDEDEPVSPFSFEVEIKKLRANDD